MIKIFKILPFILFSIQLMSQCDKINIDDVTVDTFAVKVDINWENVSNFDRYDLEIGKDGFTVGSGTKFDSIVANQVTLTDLVEHTAYDLYITSICENGDTSDIAGPIKFTTLWKNDVGIIGILRPNPFEKCNFSERDTVKVMLKNFGADPQTFIPFDVRINGQNSGVMQPVDGLYSGVLSRYGTGTIDMEVEWKLSESGNYEIVAWTELKEDSDNSNDTFKFDFISIYDNPFYQTFESLEFPERWDTEEKENPVFSEGHHDNVTATLSDHLNSMDTIFKVVTSRVKIREGETKLKFDIALRDGANTSLKYELQAKDSVQLFVSTDCGENFEIVRNFNNSDFSNIVNTITEDMSDYIDQSVNFKFKVKSENKNDFWVDFDNMNMYECRDSLALWYTTEIEDDKRIVTITPKFGFEPYEYEWSTGGTSAIEEISEGGHYTVTVTDAGGCMDTKILDFGPVAISDLDIIQRLDIYPNPASRHINVLLNTKEREDIAINVYDVFGQTKMRHTFDQVNQIQTSFETANFVNGIYFIEIIIDNQRTVSKIIIRK